MLRLVITLTLLAPTLSLCPTKCSCHLDHKGRNTVSCKQGGLLGPINLDNVSLETEVIRITAPDDNLNSLMMSPVFQSYKKLEEIHITKSNVPQLGMHFFYGLSKLEVLNLSQNNITQPLDHNFRGLDKLKELYLDDNRIHSLPSGTFRYLHELKILSIQRNRIAELVNRIFLEIGKLKVLKLSGNNLRELNPEVFRDVQELRSLECRGCSLKNMNSEIYHLVPHLAHLDLSDNEINHLTQDDLKNLTSLKYLKLDGNQIGILHDDVFLHVPLIRKLDLGRNEIATLGKGVFNHLQNLTELNLKYNKLEKIPSDVFEPISNTLEVLILSGNRLKVKNLQGISRLQNLKVLSLANCGIFDIPVKIFPDGVSILDLSYNFLGSLRNEVVPPFLVDLDLSKNQFLGLDDDILIKLDNVPSVKLEKNPWACDLCHIIPLLERTNRSLTYSEICCVSPHNMKGKKLGNVERSELSWCSPSYPNDASFFLVGEDGKISLIVASMSVCLLFLTLVAIVAAFLYSRRHAARYYTHEDKLAMERDSICENSNSPLFCDGELNFKFPLDAEKKMSIATIEEIKREHSIKDEM